MSDMTKEERLKLQIAACKVRMGVIESTHGAKAGHPGGSLSAADMFTYLYNKEMRVDPTNPKWEDRDRFVLSKGHTAPGLYSALAYRGFFPVEDLPTLRHIDSYLQGHPNMNRVPGVDMSTGSLGQGISCAAGMDICVRSSPSDSLISSSPPKKSTISAFFASSTAAFVSFWFGFLLRIYPCSYATTSRSVDPITSRIASGCFAGFTSDDPAP